MRCWENGAESLFRGYEGFGDGRTGETELE